MTMTRAAVVANGISILLTHVAPEEEGGSPLLLVLASGTDGVNGIVWFRAYVPNDEEERSPAAAAATAAMIADVRSVMKTLCSRHPLPFRFRTKIEGGGGTREEEGSGGTTDRPSYLRVTITAATAAAAAAAAAARREGEKEKETALLTLLLPRYNPRSTPSVVFVAREEEEEASAVVRVSRGGKRVTVRRPPGMLTCWFKTPRDWREYVEFYFSSHGKDAAAAAALARTHTLGTLEAPLSITVSLPDGKPYVIPSSASLIPQRRMYVVEFVSPPGSMPPVAFGVSPARRWSDIAAAPSSSSSILDFGVFLPVAPASWQRTTSTRPRRYKVVFSSDGAVEMFVDGRSLLTANLGEWRWRPNGKGGRGGGRGVSHAYTDWYVHVVPNCGTRIDFVE